MSDQPWAMVSFDIDGTLTLGHGWSIIAERFGRTAEYDQTTERYARGELGEDAHLENLLAIARGHTLREVEAALEETPRPRNIRETVDALRHRRIRTALLSHNPTYVCAWYARTFGFDAYEGCTSPPPIEGRIVAPGPVHADKLGSLHVLLEKARVEARTAVHVGDGLSDLEVFRRVGGGIALNSHLPAVREGADAVVDTDDLGDVLLALDRIHPRVAEGSSSS